ncbi:MAG: biotin--[acetyl-CoA-carboxylase] ligase [Nitrospirae bacterium]|nr:biotin--[acetyl-CoA-carboxylase] ligase [Nitrospirota bacterium]
MTQPDTDKGLQIDLILQSLHTQYIGKELIYFESTDSTNVQASILGTKGAENGTTVVTEKQTQGKGRMGRTWISPVNSNLYFSILLRPPTSPQAASWIPLVAGVALAKGISGYTGLSAKIKWPNDLLIGKKKFGGILIETHIVSNRIHYLVLGVGLNVNMTRFPEEIAPFATSLKKELGHPCHREPLLVHLLEELEKQLQDFYESGPEKTSGNWIQLSDTIGKEVTVTLGNQSIKGKAINLDPHGGLILEKRDGTKTTILTGDVVQLRTDVLNRK